MTALPRPAVGEPRPWSFPVPREARFDNGLRVLMFDLPGQHVVSAGLVLDLPLSAEPRDREGVAALTAVTLDQGTRTHPGTTFTEAVEDAGAVLETSTGYATTKVYLDVPASRLAQALPLVAEVVSEPLLEDADVDRERAIGLAHLEQQLANSAARAEHALRRALVDHGCRASRTSSGEADTLAHVGGADVRTFHGRWYGPRGATLVLAGDFEADPLPLVRDAFATWTNPNQERAEHETPVGRGPRHYLVDRPGSVQADVRLAGLTIGRADPRWAALGIGTYALGGAFLSRLNAVLREEKGFTYGAHAATSPMRSGGYTAVSGSFRNEVVAETVALLPGLVDVRERPFTEAEVDQARTYLTGVQPLQYATASGVCNGVMALLSVGLEPDYVDRLRKDFLTVTPASATRVVQELLPPDHLSLVIVGDAGVLGPALAERGVDVEVVPPGTWI